MRLRDLFLGLFTDAERSGRLKLLKQQQKLLQEGLSTHAEVMDARVQGARIGAAQPIQLWLKLQKPDGNFLYTQTSSIVSGYDLPVQGQVLHIKYLPQDLDTVVIMERGKIKNAGI